MREIIEDARALLSRNAESEQTDHQRQRRRGNHVHTEDEGRPRQGGEDGRQAGDDAVAHIGQARRSAHALRGLIVQQIHERQRTHDAFAQKRRGERQQEQPRTRVAYGGQQRMYR